MFRLLACFLVCTLHHGGAAPAGPAETKWHPQYALEEQPAQLVRNWKEVAHSPDSQRRVRVVSAQIALASPLGSQTEPTEFWQLMATIRGTSTGKVNFILALLIVVVPLAACVCRSKDGAGGPLVNEGQEREESFSNGFSLDDFTSNVAPVLESQDEPPTMIPTLPAPESPTTRLLHLTPASPTANEADSRNVQLDSSSGQSVGMGLKPGMGGRGLHVATLTPGGQAEKTGV